MDNILHYPQSTIVSRVVPKTMFYKFMEVNPRMKSRFVNDVVNITWLYKLSASTLNVTDTEEMKEIEVFVVNLKQPDCPTDLFTFIDINMPHHIVFVLVHDESAMLLINYKDWTDFPSGKVASQGARLQHPKFRIRQAFASPWMPMADLELSVQGQSLPRIYDNFVAQVGGIGRHRKGSMEEIVALRQRIGKETKELEQLEKRMRREQQVDIQMHLHAQARSKREVIKELKQKLEEMGA